MLTFSNTLSTQLSQALTQGIWLNSVAGALGSNKTLTIKHDPTANASTTADAIWSNGTTCYQSNLTGSIVFSNGSITSFGGTSNVTVNNSVNFNTGSAVLRITGGGEYLQGTIGLAGSGRDFSISGNLNGTSGLGFKANLQLSAPKYLPLGSDTEPLFILFDDYSSGSLGTSTRVVFDEVGADIVWQDSELAAEMGSIPYTRSTATVVHGTGGDAFEFGFHRFTLPASLNDQLYAPVHQILVVMKPYGRWSSYPFADTYNSATDSTFPKPFKIRIYSSSGILMDTIEMKRDNIPVNDPSMAQYRDSTHALRPFVNTKMALPWVSHRIKASSKAAKWFPGMTNSGPDISFRHTMAKEGTSANSAIPLANGNSPTTQRNSAGQYFALPKWPLPWDNVYGGNPGNQNALDSEVSDPYLYDITTYYPDEGKNSRMEGWAYEPGSSSGHNWFTGPGGVRFDRYAIPTPLALYMTDPDGVRLKGNVPNRELCDNWGLAYFNHAHHEVKNVRTLETLPTNVAAYSGYANIGSYYGTSNPIYVPGGLSTHINLHGLTSGSQWPPADKDGRHHWNGWSLDYLHSYCQPGLWAMFFNSPIHMISAKSRFFAHMTCQLGAGPTANPAGGLTEASNFFMTRRSAWRWLHYAVMWKIATTHPLGIDRATIEDCFQKEIEAIHDYVYVPSANTGHANYNHIYFQSIRNLGIPCEERNDNVNHWYQELHNSKAFYMSGVFALMKQTGSWAAMRAKSVKCQLAMDFMLTCYAKFSATRILATEGRMEGYTDRLTPAVPIGSQLTLPSDWYAWNSYYPKNGQEDLVHNADGSMRGDREVSQHLAMQHCFIMRDYFPEYNLPDINEACLLYRSYNNAVTAWSAAGATNRNKAQRDHGYRHPSACIYRSPVEA